MTLKYQDMLENLVNNSKGLLEEIKKRQKDELQNQMDELKKKEYESLMGEVGQASTKADEISGKIVTDCCDYTEFRT